MVNKKTILIFIIILILIFSGIYFQKSKSSINNNDNVPTPVITNPDIEINTPTPNSAVKSPLTVSGKIDSSWMFEGVFPIKILDSQKNVLVQNQGHEVEPGSWTNPGKIPFTATLNFKPTTTTGFLVIENDNPSGLPENQKTYEIPIKFAF